MMVVRGLQPNNVQAAKLERAQYISRRQQALQAAAGEIMPQRRWHVLLIDDGDDILVDNTLANAGVERWMASTEWKPKRRRRGKWQPFCPIVQPALPGYLFVHVHWSADVSAALRELDGVAGIIGGWSTPAPLKHNEVEKLRARVEEDPEFLAILVKAFKVGDTVRIDDGAFASFLGVIKALWTDAGRVRINGNIFGREVPIVLGVDQISKVE